MRAFLGSRSVRIGLVGVFLLTGFLVLLRAVDVNTLLLGRDPTAAADVAPWFGALSQIGLMLWAASVGICLIGGAVLRGTAARDSGFLFGTAALAAVLGIDDAYLIHEAVAPEDIGIPESIAYLFLSGCVLAWVWTFRERIADSDWPLLALAAALLGTSVVIDHVAGIPALLEDATKYMAIAVFAAWCFGEASRLLRGDPASDRRRPPLPADATPRQAR